eukprot:357148_1
MSFILAVIPTLYLLQTTISQTVPSVTFGLQTGQNTNAGTGGTVTMTLFWENSIFQCNINPTEISTFYSCSPLTSTNTNTLLATQCNPIDYPSNIQYAIQIDNPSSDSVDVETLIITFFEPGMTVPIFNWIQYYCFNEPHRTVLGLNSFSTTTKCLYTPYGGFHELRIETDPSATNPGYPHNFIEFNMASEESNVTNVSYTPQCIPLTPTTEIPSQSPHNTPVPTTILIQSAPPSKAPIIFIPANISMNIPDGMNISEVLCIFGSHHSFVDGTYVFAGWNIEVGGPIYYDSNEHKYLYPQIINKYIYQWQLHEDYDSVHSYSRCDMQLSDNNRFYAEKCPLWKTDIDQSEIDTFEEDIYMTISKCNENAFNNQHSITFEIETLWSHDGGAIEMTLYWSDKTYKCTIYPNHYDGDYSCNSMLNSIQCDTTFTNNPIQYGLQIDVFIDEEDHTVVSQHQDFKIQRVTIKYMIGNVVRDVHIMEHFCLDYNINDTTQCNDTLTVVNHTLITFSYQHENTTYMDVDALHTHIQHTQSLSQCVPDGFPLELNKYQLVNKMLSYSDASQYCKDVFNTTLVSINSTEDLLNAVALRELNNTNQDIWIGLTSIRTHGTTWEWVDGTHCDNTVSGKCKDSFWAHGKPEGDSFEWCAEMSGVDVFGYFNDDVCEKKNIFLCQSTISSEIPEEWIDRVLSEVCVFGSHHSFLDGTYKLLAWNNAVNGPIYYDSHEHKYLYPQITKDIIYEWQIHENYLSPHKYSFCDTLITDPNKTFVEHCIGWETDIDQDEEFEFFEHDPLVTVRACDHGINHTQDSITFEIETMWDNDGGAVELTLFWEGSTYKCTVYSSHIDGDYSCNTLLSAVKCDASLTDNPIEYGLQLDVFSDSEEHKTTDEGICIHTITIKYMEGNVVRDVHILEHFCLDDSHDTTGECDEMFIAKNHTLVTFTYKHDDNIYEDIDALPTHIEHRQSIPQCVPEGYGLIGNKYLLVTEPKSWKSSQQYCETHYNSTLATIISDDDLLNAVALRELNNSNEDVWIGLNVLQDRKIWRWIDGTSCVDYTPDGTCKSDIHWAPHKPDIYDNFGQWCAEMSGVNAHGYFNDDVCESKHIFLCDYPTPEPTLSPTMGPTLHPTHEVHVDHLGIVNHKDIKDNWIAFSLENADLSCGGDITSIAISQEYPRPGYVWLEYTSNISYLNKTYYVFELNKTFIAPLSVQVNRSYDYDEQKHEKANETVDGLHVMINFIPREHFDFGENFCRKDYYATKEEINKLFYMIMGVLIFAFSFIALTAWIDAQCCRKNDHLVITAILSSLFQTLDMVSDIFFCIEVWHTYNAHSKGTSKRTQFLIICILSVIFIIIPILISLYQLYRASAKEWLADNRIREWLKTYTPLLYFSSIITGSSFNAIQIFNSNLYGLDIFYMGLHRKHIMSFSTKKLHSIIVFENLPQLGLSCWYLVVLGRLSWIPLTQIAFSLISIIVTIITIVLQTRIDRTQDFIYIAIDVEGDCIMESRARCKNRIIWLKKYMARIVLGVNAKWVEVQKPFAGAVRNGLRMEMYVSFVHQEDKEKLENHYQRMIQTYIDNGLLAKEMRQQWKLQTDIGPNISVKECVFNESKARAKRNATKANVFNNNNNKSHGKVNKIPVNTYTTDDDDDFITSDDELQNLKTEPFISVGGTTNTDIKETELQPAYDRFKSTPI